MDDVFSKLVEKVDGLHFQIMGVKHAISALSGKLDVLIEALAQDEEEQPSRTLDGEVFPNGERDPNQPL